jgi:uncharacterized protein
LILAAWCFARSSRRAEAWILDHPKFGPPIVAWWENGTIARGHKALSIGGMAIGFMLFAATAHPTWWLTVAVAAALMGCSVYVASRPEPPESSMTVGMSSNILLPHTSDFISARMFLASTAYWSSRVMENSRRTSMYRPSLPAATWSRSISLAPSSPMA